MPVIQYRAKKFGPQKEAMIEAANQIIYEYQEQGFDLTLRQLYYQFVSRDLIPNTQKDYKTLGKVISEARLAGMIDWNTITDRTRNLERKPFWEHASHFMESVVPQFAVDKWKDQDTRVEVWIEKDALVGVIEPVCRAEDVAYFSCRGYTSQSEMWSASQRLIEYNDAGQKVVILHLGDHDPSGKDMTRDIEDRLVMFQVQEVEVIRIALNMDQIRKYDPPPNPAKITDPRAKEYIKKFGQTSWELDALEPQVIAKLIQDNIAEYRDVIEWDNTLERELRNMKSLKKAAKAL